jgi:curved DNA-binding protein CbpA
MTNHFATLDLPQRPWLDAETIKDAFHRLGAAQHPDAPAGNAAAFAAVNAAWQVLRAPATRLRHLLELEGLSASKNLNQIPPVLGDLFMDLATLRRCLEEFLRRQSAGSSALAVALLAGERLALAHKFHNALARLDATSERALEKVRTIDSGWEKRDTEAVECLTALQQELTFAAKWSQQLREGLFQLET